MSFKTPLINSGNDSAGNSTYGASPERLQHEVKRKITLIGTDPSPKQFWYDCNGMEDSLIYDGQSVRQKFDAMYTDLNRAQAILAVAEQIEERTEGEQDREELARLDEKVQSAKDSLFGEKAGKGAIWEDFTKYLSSNLKDKNKQHVIEEVTWRFSQNALVCLMGQVNEFTTKKFNGLFMAEPGVPENVRKCTLKIKDGTPEITVELDNTYSKLISSSEGVKQLDTPVRVKGTMVMTVKPNTGLLSCCCCSLPTPTKTVAHVKIEIFGQENLPGDT